MTLLLQTGLCVFFPKEIYHESKVSAPPLHFHSKELPYCRWMCEWKSSFCSSLHPRFTMRTEDGGWVCLDGNRTEMELPDLTAYISFHHKGIVSFSLTICLLHVSMVVKPCVICCDSFIALKSTDVFLLSLQIQQGVKIFM